MICIDSKYKIKVSKIILLFVSAFASLLTIPFWSKEIIEDGAGYSFVRYLLAVLIAIPALIYSIKKYKRTASRFYVLPCFAIVVGFWIVSMFFMQRLPESLNQTNAVFAAKQKTNSLMRTSRNMFTT
ncbi:MAG: hypothetical protein LBG19_07105 [Prevotellaceae bacterium]|jgi:hypothetical protein|nr:hypothetical protein [Prevotellaceae bacterium]